jgi:tetratricopeptide (TPR) repeat protein
MVGKIVGRASCGGILLLLSLVGDPLFAQGQPPAGPLPGESTTTAPAPGPVPRSDAPLAVIQTSRLRGVSARVAALMMSGQQGGSIPIAVLAVPIAMTAEKTRVFFVADIEGTNLLAGQEKPTVQVEIYAYAITEQGSVGGDLAETFTLGLDQAIDLLSRGSIKFLGALDAPPGAFALRVLVRNAQVGSFGVTEAPHVTPSGEGTLAFLSPLLAGEPAAEWVLAREAGDESRWGALGHPFSFLAAASVPSARPVLASETVATLWALVRGAAPGAATLPIKVVGRGGKEVARIDATVLERRDSGISDATLLRLSVPVPALGPAPYILELSAAPMTPGVQLASSIGVVVADPETVKAQNVWVRFGAPRQGEGAESRRKTSFSGRAGRSKPSAKVAGEYRSALEHVESQPLAKVLDAIAELETASLPTGSAAEWETLVASEKQVAGELGDARPASVLALAYIHGRLYREYAERQKFLLTTHARRMIEELAVFYAEKAGKAANPVVADILAELAGSLQQSGLLSTAERIFRRALQFDPENRASLIGLAAGLERVGQYRLASEFLAKLVEMHKDDAEARLRLGVNLARLGEHEKSGRLLQACTQEVNPAWVRVVAYEEVARSLVEAGQFEKARHLLAEAVGRFPGDEQLTIALAYVLDRLHRPLEARTVADRLRPAPRGEGSSPRFRYSEWPTEDLQRSRATASTAGQGALAALREALSTRPRAEGRS